jgi:hypothetical protein
MCETEKLMSTEVVQEVETPAQQLEAPSEGSHDEAVLENLGENEANADEGQVVVLVDDKPLNQEESQAETTAPEWVRDLRKQHREAQRKIREQDAEIQRLKVPVTQPQTMTIKTKPRLEDFDFDTDKYETAVIEWHDHKRQIDALNEQAKQAEEAQKRNWAQRLETYKSSRSSLKLEDYDQAEDTVQQNLNVVQQGIIIQGAENPALVVYALGKDPEKAKEFAKIVDPVKFAIAVGKLETKLKISSRKPPPPPSTVRGNASVSGAVDSHLDRLRQEAERTGDYTKVHQYRQQKREGVTRG